MPPHAPFFLSLEKDGREGIYMDLLGVCEIKKKKGNKETRERN